MFTLLERFPGALGSVDFSGFDEENWHERTGAEHRELVQSKVTNSDRNKAKSESGCHYSVFLKLPYLNSPRMLIIDPYALFGHQTLSKITTHWKRDYFETQFDVIQQGMDQ